jgi:murein DD-endopeptidase MepM/ murein hydrolase activator NlpD
VSKGQKVARGDVIAGVGSTGHSTAPHLHYEVIRDDKAMNPRDFILARDFVVD